MLDLVRLMVIDRQWHQMEEGVADSFTPWDLKSGGHLVWVAFERGGYCCLGNNSLCKLHFALGY